MMKSVLIAAVSAVQAYLLGSIDTGILVSKFLYHDDVRKYAAHLRQKGGGTYRFW